MQYVERVRVGKAAAVGTVRVMVADDHRVFVDALAARLEAEPDLAVVGRAHTAAAATSMAMSVRPNVLLLDVGFGDAPDRVDEENGLAVAERLRVDLPTTRIVILTARDDGQTACAAALAGVSGFVSKDSATTDLIAAIRSVAQNHAWFQPRVLRHVLDELARRSPSLTPDQQRLTLLTDRETEVFQWMVRGLDRVAIGREMYLSTNTIRTHVRNILRKLDVHSTLEAVAFGLRAGLTPAKDSA